MAEMKSSALFKTMLIALYTAAGRRTSQSFAVAVLGTIIKTLEQKYSFLEYVIIHPESYSADDIIEISSELDSIHPVKLGKAVEAIVRVIYMDLKDKAGLYFIKELKNNAGEKTIAELFNYGVDLDLLQIEQHYIYRRQSAEKVSTALYIGGDKGKKEKKQDDKSLLGYSWRSVGSWKYDSKSRSCTIFDKKGKKLDNLNMDSIIRNHIGRLSGDDIVESPSDYGEEEIEISEKELELLKMMYSRDVDIVTACALLHINEQNLDIIIKRLLKIEMLHYVKHDEVELTEIAKHHLKEKNSS